MNAKLLPIFAVTVLTSGGGPIHAAPLELNIMHLENITIDDRQGVGHVDPISHVANQEAAHVDLVGHDEIQGQDQVKNHGSRHVDPLGYVEVVGDKK